MARGTNHYFNFHSNPLLLYSPWAKRARSFVSPFRALPLRAAKWIWETPRPSSSSPRGPARLGSVACARLRTRATTAQHQAGGGAVRPRGSLAACPSSPAADDVISPPVLAATRAASLSLLLDVRPAVLSHGHTIAPFPATAAAVQMRPVQRRRCC